jgi:cytochrome c551/c552
MRYWIIVLTAMVGWTFPAAAEPVTFATRLNAKFHHERCLSCHQFNSPQHQGRAFGSHRSRYLCVQCHRPDVIGLAPNSEWVAPNNMDYTDFTPVDTCRLIKRRTGVDPSGQKLVRHLLTDGRVRWALDSGMTPGGQKETVPGGYAEWKSDVEAWVKDGMRCE